MLRGLLLLLSALALTAPAAVAQDDKIFVDPGSPSGKEYALPVESARKQAAKDAQQRSSSAQPAPLFGEGVDDRSTADAGGSGGAGSGSGAARGGGGGTADADGGRPGAPGASASPATLRAQAAAPDGGIGLAAVIAVGAGVLLLGGAIGVLLRRRSARGV